MNSGVIAALLTAAGAVVIAVISAMAARRTQSDQTQTDRLTIAQAETDRIIANLQQQCSMLWDRVTALQNENDVLRKRIRVFEGD